MTPYDTSFARTDRMIRENHGLPWTLEMEDTLTRLFIKGASLKEMALTMERKGDSVLTRLCKLSLIERNPYDDEDYFITPHGQQLINDLNNYANLSEKFTMIDTNKTIEIKTFIQGVDATQMTDAQIFSLIAEKEQEIEKLRSIKVASSKLAAAISALQDDVQHLAEFVDSRP